MTRDARDLLARARGRRRCVDADHAVRASVGREADDHPGLRAARDRADDDVVEAYAELRLLRAHFFRKADEAEAAERMLGAAGRDRIRTAAGLSHAFERFLPAAANADVEAVGHEPHVGAHHPR